MKTIVKNGSAEIETPTGIKILAPRQTKIIEAHDYGDLVLIREDYYGYKGSNVYAVDGSLNVIWEAKLFYSEDTFANYLKEENGKFVTVTWGGNLCTIDPLSGETIKIRDV